MKLALLKLEVLWMGELQTQPLQTLPVRAIDAENFRRIPSARVTFPQQGRYQLTLNCTRPQPFQLNYETVVR